MSFSILHLIFSGFHIPDSPGSNDLHVGSQSLDGQFETDLVIALARSTMADGISAVLLCHVHQAFADEGTAKEVPRRYFPSYLPSA